MKPGVSVLSKSAKPEATEQAFSAEVDPQMAHQQKVLNAMLEQKQQEMRTSRPGAPLDFTLTGPVLEQIARMQRLAQRIEAARISAIVQGRTARK